MPPKAAMIGTPRPPPSTNLDPDVERWPGSYLPQRIQKVALTYVVFAAGYRCFALEDHGALKSPRVD